MITPVALAVELGAGRWVVVSTARMWLGLQSARSCAFCLRERRCIERLIREAMCAAALEQRYALQLLRRRSWAALAGLSRDRVQRASQTASMRE